MKSITSKNPTFTVTFKLRFESKEETYETSFYNNLDELEEELERKGSYGKVSYYKYSQKGGQSKWMYFH